MSQNHDKKRSGFRIGTKVIDNVRLDGTSAYTAGIVQNALVGIPRDVTGKIPRTTLGRLFGEMSSSVIVDSRDLNQYQSIYENILYGLERHMDYTKNNNDVIMKSYESRLFRMEDLVAQIHAQSNRNMDLLDMMTNFLDHANDTQNKLFGMVEKIVMKHDESVPKKLITDKDEIREKILALKNNNKTFNPGMLAVDQDWDIDVVMEIVGELRRENQLEVIDSSDKISDNISEGFITDKVKIKKMLLDSKVPDKIFNPGVFSIEHDLDVDAVLEVIEELRNEKHLVAAHD